MHSNELDVAEEIGSRSNLFNIFVYSPCLFNNKDRAH